MDRASEIFPPNDRASQIQGDSVRAVWGSAEVDERKPLRRDPPPREPEPEQTDDVLRLRLAEELDFARRLIEALGDELSADVAVVMRHGFSLQSIDRAAQMLGHVANVVRCSVPEAAVERIGMAEMKARLKRKSLG